MDYDITESLMSSWLRYVKGCQIVENNWHYVINHDDINEINNDEILNVMKQRIKSEDKVSTILKDTEIDSLGISIKNNEINFYIIETAFHSYTLKYRDNKKSIKGKCVRGLMSIYRTCQEMKILDTNTVNIYFYFITPNVSDKEIRKINGTLRFINKSYNELLNNKLNIVIDTVLGQERFKKDIIKPLLNNDKNSKYENNNDNSAVFLRACKLLDSVNYINRKN